jgi:hypothetical protein
MFPFAKQNMNCPGLLHKLSVLLVIPLALTLLSSNVFAAVAKNKIVQKTFSTPEEAAQALAAAAKADDDEQLLAVLGPQGKQLIFSGDEVEDKAGLDRFTRSYDENNQVVRKGDDTAVLEVGKDEWPMPIPIVKTRGGEWRFDTRQGKEEILNRRIGRNELSAIQVCLAFVDAQREYASKDRNGDGVLEYAQKFSSDRGQKNGLYWETKEGEEQSPLGPLVGEARKEGYTKRDEGQPTPYHGYFYKILKAQGKNAPRGAYKYVQNGRMVGGFAMVAYPAEYGMGGFAMVAYPAEYGTSGIMTFVVSQDGVVYEINMGKKAASTARAMTSFDPDKQWNKVKTKDTEYPGD